VAFSLPIEPTEPIQLIEARSTSGRADKTLTPIAFAFEQALLLK
jgi:hypothetical protein